MFPESQSSAFWFQLVQGLCAGSQHVVNFFYLVRVLYLQNNSRIWLRILSIDLKEELKVLDFVLQLNNYYFVLLDCIPLFLYFLTSLIKFALWNSGKAQEAKAFIQRRGREKGGLSLGRPHSDLLSFNPILLENAEYYLHIVINNL